MEIEELKALIAELAEKEQTLMRLFIDSSLDSKDIYDYMTWACCNLKNSIAYLEKALALKEELK